MGLHSLFALALLLAALPPYTVAQRDALMSSLTLGVDFYPEAWSTDSVLQAAAAMQRAGITRVRVAEFAWHKFQPAMGAPYNFSWLDDALSVLSAHGILAIIGTPTASPPSWLYTQDPSIALVDATGLQYATGSRQNLNHLHPLIISETRAIVGAIGAHYADDDRVAGFQIDNEIHGGECSDCADCLYLRYAF